MGIGYLKFTNENIPITEYYSLKELSSFAGTDKIVSCTVINYDEDLGIVLDLGNGIEGCMHTFNFEDNTGSSKLTIISFIGQKIEAYVDSVENNIVYLNRAKLQRDYKVKYLNTLPIGSIIDARIASIADFGAFVDLGYGVVGLLPIGDISIARFPTISDVLSKGDFIKVVYKGLLKSGYVVTHKELLGTWEENLNDIGIGSYCLGIVRELKPYGAFIELNPNITGLAEIPNNLHIAEGDSVRVQLRSINPEKLKVKLAIISKSSIEYKVRYKYRIESGILTNWEYTPKNSIKSIKTVFKE